MNITEITEDGSDGCHWDEKEYLKGPLFEYLDQKVKQIFADLLGIRNRITWTDGDIEDFLATEENIIFECIPHIPLENFDASIAIPSLKQFHNSKKIIVCIYSNYGMNPVVFDKILTSLITSIPINRDKTGVLHGWINDEKADKNSVTIKLIAV